MIYLRNVTKDDVNILYEWANDPVVRNNSFNSKQIMYDEHVAWFDRIINSKDVLQFIMMKDKIPIGQIRLNINGDIAEIGYSISEQYRGHGYGHIILKLVSEKIRDEYPSIKQLIAKVKSENISSMKSFEKSGYNINYYCYSYDI